MGRFHSTPAIVDIWELKQLQCSDQNLCPLSRSTDCLISGFPRQGSYCLFPLQIIWMFTKTRGHAPKLHRVCFNCILWDLWDTVPREWPSNPNDNVTGKNMLEEVSMVQWSIPNMRHKTTELEQVISPDRKGKGYRRQEQLFIHRKQQCMEKKQKSYGFLFLFCLKNAFVLRSQVFSIVFRIVIMIATSVINCDAIMLTTNPMISLYWFCLATEFNFTIL